jgi:hypothetical protein
MPGRHIVFAVLIALSRRRSLISELLVVGVVAAIGPVSVRAAAQIYYVSPAGSDANSGLDARNPLGTIQRAVNLAVPGSEIMLAPGIYKQDVVSRRSGTPQSRITISGPASAVVTGGGADRIFTISHSYMTLRGFTIDGHWDGTDSRKAYRNKLLYVQGTGLRNGVNGLNVQYMTFRNAGGECLRLRYFVQHSEIAFSTFQHCGIYDFRFGGGGRNGEAIYIGTAPEQLDDGRNPTPDRDESNNNWIHHNTFDTRGNECVDIKEGSSGNIVEYNRCTGQQDPKSAGFDARGNSNVFRHNESFGNLGAGVRLGGDGEHDGIGNSVHDNYLHDNRAGGIKFQRAPQAAVCGNVMANNGTGHAVGRYSKRFAPHRGCPSP